MESNSAALDDAVVNRKINGVSNISFYHKDAGVFLSNMAAGDESADIVFMDPPRSGSTRQFMDAVIRLAPRRVVYISCNPETLARDLRYLCARGYAAVKAIPFDQFPWTDHVECVCLLVNKN